MDPSELSRRKLLAGLATAGSAGAVVGSGTAGLLTAERDDLDFTLASGALELQVDWNTVEGNAEFEAEDGQLALNLDLGPKSLTGSGKFTLSLDNGEQNPAYVWLEMDCPELGSSKQRELADHLSLGLSYASGDTLVSMRPLTDFADELASGRPLDYAGDSDVDPGSRECLPADGALTMVLDWELDEEFSGEAALDLSFGFVGQQCRHNQGVENPIPASTCEPEERCCCEPLGKIETEGKHLEPGETFRLTDDVGEYDLHVLETETKTETKGSGKKGRTDGEVVAVSFEVTGVGETPDPSLCGVKIKGGPGKEPYDLDGTSNDTGGLLYAPERQRNTFHGRGDKDGHYEISWIRVFVCRDREECETDRRWSK